MTESMRKHIYISVLVAAAIGFWIAWSLADKIVGAAESAGVITIKT